MWVRRSTSTRCTGALLAVCTRLAPRPLPASCQDDVHPFGDTGHRYAAELLIALTQTTVGSLEAEPWVEGGEEAAWIASPLPPPMIPNNYEHHSSVCMLQVGCWGWAVVGARVQTGGRAE